MWHGSERGRSRFCPPGTFPLLSLIHRNAIIGGSEDVKKQHSFFCIFPTKARMDWEDLFVIVTLCTLPPVWRSTWLFQTFPFWVFNSALPPHFHPNGLILCWPPSRSSLTPSSANCLWSLLFCVSLLLLPFVLFFYSLFSFIFHPPDLVKMFTVKTLAVRCSKSFFFSLFKKSFPLQSNQFSPHFFSPQV